MNKIEELQGEIEKIKKEKALEIGKELQNRDYFTANDVKELGNSEISFSDFKKYVPIEKTYKTEINEISLSDLCKQASVMADEYYYDEEYDYDYEYINGELKIYETITYVYDPCAYYKIKGEEDVS